MDAIRRFRGQYDFLSNFYVAPVTYCGVTYTNSEAAFQAQKSIYPGDRIAFSNLDPASAKKRGRKVPLRADWDEICYDIMRDVVHAKFVQNLDLADKLLATGDAYLEEGNNWNDRKWGTVNGEGTNWLGKILMETRDWLRSMEGA